MMGTEPVALYFGADAAPVFGHYHAASVPRAVGLVFCSAFGREELSSHRAWRDLALQAARSGWPVLRYDLPCTGDSAGDSLADDLPARWCASAHAAIDELRRLSGVEKVVLVALRSGSLVAWPAALERDDVAGLACVAPVTSGRAWVRELKALEAAAQGNALPSPEGVFESGGFEFSETARAALAEVDLRRSERSPACPVLLVDRAELPALEPWARELAAAGTVVQRLVLPGYEKLMLDPHRAKPPQAMWEAVLAWLSTLPAPPRGHAGSGAPRTFAQWNGVREEPVVLAVGPGHLCGIVSSPAEAAESGRTLLLLNAGATRRIGPSRLHVDLARDWARQGHRVVRLDLSGLGDSPAWPGCPDTIVYSPTAVQEVCSVVEQLRSAPGARHMQLLGLCAGAYHAFKAAVRGAAVDDVIAINPLTFFWHEGMSLDAPLAAHKVADDMMRYRSGLLDPARWRKLLSGGVHVRRLVAVVAHAARQAAARPLREVARVLHLPVQDDLAAELKSVVRRNVGIHFLIAEDDPGDVLLHDQAGRMARRLLSDGKVTLRHFDGADHVFTRHAARTALAQALKERVAATPRG